MVVSVVQSVIVFGAGPVSTTNATLTGVAAGNAIIAQWHAVRAGSVTSVDDGSAYTQNGSTINTAATRQCAEFVRTNLAGGSVTVTITLSANDAFTYRFVLHEVSGLASVPSDGFTAQDQAAPGTATDAVTSGSITPSQNGDLILGYTENRTENATITAGTGFTAITPSGLPADAGIEKQVQTTAAAIAATFTPQFNDNWTTHVSAWKAAPGITFDAASNSGDQAASANYTFSRTVSQASPFLSVNVELLTVPGATVTSVTDDDGGGNVPLTFIGARSTVTGAGRVECWGLANPASGTKTIRVILSAAIESVATAQIHGGVHQTVPTEAFNSAQATNAGSATDASVAITTIADNCWVIGACVANKTGITANQTSRNNISGTLGSGADEDNGAAKTPAGSVTMSYTGMGITTTWAIAGYALRPLAASGGFVPYTNPMKSLMAR